MRSRNNHKCNAKKLVDPEIVDGVDEMDDVVTVNPTNNEIL